MRTLLALLLVSLPAAGLAGSATAQDVRYVPAASDSSAAASGYNGPFLSWAGKNPSPTSAPAPDAAPADTPPRVVEQHRATVVYSETPAAPAPPTHRHIVDLKAPVSDAAAAAEHPLPPPAAPVPLPPPSAPIAVAPPRVVPLPVVAHAPPVKAASKKPVLAKRLPPPIVTTPPPTVAEVTPPAKPKKPLLARKSPALPVVTTPPSAVAEVTPPPAKAAPKKPAKPALARKTPPKSPATPPAPVMAQATPPVLAAPPAQATAAASASSEALAQNIPATASNSPPVGVRFYSIDRDYGDRPDPIAMPQDRPMVLVGPPADEPPPKPDDQGDGDKSADPSDQPDAIF